MLTGAIARFQVPGFHAWPDAPTHRDYLRVRHRHQFHIEVEAQVTHGDREIEIHDLMVAAKGALSRFYRCDTTPGGPEGWFEFGSLSCEHIAKHVASALRLAFGVDRIYIVRVLEDGEAGGVVMTGAEMTQ